MRFTAKGSAIRELIALLRANHIARITSDFKMDLINGVIVLVISNRPHASRSSDFQITRAIAPSQAC